MRSRASSTTAPPRARADEVAGGPGVPERDGPLAAALAIVACTFDFSHPIPPGGRLPQALAPLASRGSGPVSRGRRARRSDLFRCVTGDLQQLDFSD